MIWSGWEIRNSLVVKPRRVRLVPEELAVMTYLMQQRIAYQERRFTAPETLQKIAKASSLNALRIIIARLRSAIGREAIETKKNVGYLLLPANDTQGNNYSPIDELVVNLELSLKEARRLQKSIREGLYHE